MLPRWLLRLLQQLNVILSLGSGRSMGRGDSASHDRSIRYYDDLPMPAACITVLGNHNVEVGHNTLANRCALLAGETWQAEKGSCAIRRKSERGTVGSGARTSNALLAGCGLRQNLAANPDWIRSNPLGAPFHSLCRFFLERGAQRTVFLGLSSFC